MTGNQADCMRLVQMPLAAPNNSFSADAATVCP